MRAAVATNEARRTVTTSAHNEVTGAEDQWQCSTGARRRGSNNVTRARAESKSNVEAEFSAKQMEALTKMFAGVLAQAGIGPAVPRA